MNVSTSSAAVTASTSDVSSTQSQSKTSKTKSTDKSFEDEMKTASDTDKDNKVEASKDDKKTSSDKKTEKDSTKEANKLSQELQNSDDIVSDDLLKGGINFTDFKYHNEGQSILSQNIQNLINTKDLMSTINSASTFDYDVINMSDSDANFFANLV